MTTDIDWPALVLSVIPGGCLLWGVVTGKMPMRYGTFERGANASGFWMMALVWGCLFAILLWVGLGL